MTCNCMETVLENAQKKVLDKAPNHLPDTFKVRWKNSFFVLGGHKTREAVALPVNVKYRQVKNSGEPYKNITSDTINVFMSYCPFCGESLDEGEDGDLHE
jgi:hypothetical protein